MPKAYGASLPDGKNSSLNYLDIIKNHKLKNKEERDIYLVINGPGFKENQIDDLKRELEEIKGVRVVDLHQCDWSEIDTGWKIDGKDISIKDFFKDMHNMTDEQRMYFAVEIDTFRLIALALLKQFTEHEGGIYIDFDSLKDINSHIGKDIIIPEGILFGSIQKVSFLDGMRDSKCVDVIYIKKLSDCDKYEYVIHECDEDQSDCDLCNDDQYEHIVRNHNEDQSDHDGYECGEYQPDYDKCKITGFFANNDFIAIDSSSIVINILSLYKGKVLNQKATCQKIEETLSSVTEAELDTEFSPAISNKEYRSMAVKSTKKKIEDCVINFKKNGIKELYNIENFHYINESNLAQESVVAAIKQQLLNKKVSECLLFSFDCNNGNYVPPKGDLSWTKGKGLYRVESELKEVEVAAMENLSPLTYLW